MALISLESLPFFLLHHRSLVKESNRKIFYSTMSKGMELPFNLWILKCYRLKYEIFAINLIH
jgi:hypothetical protein